MSQSLSYLLTFVCGFLMVISAWLDSTVFNENGRLASGILYYKTGDYSSFRVNPPLTSLTGAIPSLLTGAKSAKRSELTFSPFERVEYQAGYLFAKNNPKYRYLLFAGRFCCICILLVCYLITFRYAISLYGTIAVILFICTCLFSPYFLGHGHLITPDVSSGAIALLSIYFFRRWLFRFDYKSALVAGLVLGLAELTKFTLLIFYPLLPLLWIITKLPMAGTVSYVSLRKQLVHIILIFTVSLFVINMGYMFEGTGKLLRSYKFQTSLLTGYKNLNEIPLAGGNRFDGRGNFAESLIGYVPVPLPKNFVQGVDTQLKDFEHCKNSYLRGSWSKRGWWYYYLYAILLKNPLGTIGLFLLALFCTFFLRGYNAGWRDELVVLFPGIALLVFVSSQTGFSVHSRYAIPALPFFYLWSAKVARAFTPQVKAASPKSSRVVRWITVFMLTWSVGSSLWVYPHSIAYFNELAAVLPTPEDRNYPHPKTNLVRTPCQKICRFLDAGPLNGPRHLLDSNIDWGQDVYGLERWCKRHQDIDDLTLLTWTGPPIYRTSIPIPKPGTIDLSAPRWYAVSVNFLYGENKEYRSFLNFAPEAIIGYTIYVYHVSPEELQRAENQNSQKGTVR